MGAGADSEHVGQVSSNEDAFCRAWRALEAVLTRLMSTVHARMVALEWALHTHARHSAGTLLFAA